MAIALAVHGGAWNVPDGEVEPHRAGVATALVAGWTLLRDGASAVDAVEHAVRILEEDPIFNAGVGSHLNRAGRVEMDASIMSGASLEAGAVAALERISHPVSLARRVMEASEHVLLVGGGAQTFAREQGFERCRARDLLSGRERERYLAIRADTEGARELIAREFSPGGEGRTDDSHMGTVGAVAVDRDGNVAAATSTGGTQDKYPGRVGDTSLIGAGTYADNHAGAVSCTGWGEGILRVVLAKGVVDRLAAGEDPSSAANGALRTLERVGGHAGFVLVDHQGNTTAAFNTPRMARGLASEADGLWVGVDANLVRCPEAE